MNLHSLDNRATDQELDLVQGDETFFSCSAPVSSHYRLWLFPKHPFTRLLMGQGVAKELASVSTFYYIS